MFLTINTNEKMSEGISLTSSVVTQLQRSLDNRNGNLSIALIGLNYVIGYYNITPENAIVYYVGTEGEKLVMSRKVYIIFLRTKMPLRIS